MEKQNKIINQQRQKVIELYEHIALIYEDQILSKGEYQVSRLLKEIYAKYEIVDGKILDVGCGTGKVKEYLGEKFEYVGIDIAPTMVEEARKKGYETYTGSAEDVIQQIADKSVDHVIAMSSLYYIKDFEELVREFERVARRTLFISLEQFNLENIEILKGNGIHLYNHPASLITNPTEVVANVFLWKRPSNDDKNYGDIVFKKIVI